MQRTRDRLGGSGPWTGVWSSILAVMVGGCSAADAGAPPAHAAGPVSSSAAAPQARVAADDEGPRSAAPRPIAPAGSTACAELRRAHERAFEDGDFRLCAEHERPSRALIEHTFGCFQTSAGVVAQYVERVERIGTTNAGPCPRLALHTVARHPRTGDEEQGTTQLAGGAPPDELLGSLDRLVGAFDFDGDGSPERLLQMLRVAGYRGAPVLNIFTADAGVFAGAQRYTQTLGDSARGVDAPRIDRAEDVDGDGRPDLILRTPFTAEWGSAQDLAPLLLVHVPLLAHSLPGGSFSESDEVSRSFARRSCPEPPAALAPASDTQAARIATGKRIACARLWGQSPTQVLAALRPHCTKFDEPFGGDEGRERNRLPRPLAAGECPFWWRQWAEAPVPFTLR